eukprot:c46057_g1_i1.p1 GENE.c46057_g1_i1~~c46057_g1_i1.p1  ORF type:complete len:569 (+),score=127.51 c46057_g1_i1:507-2213(+)
MEFLSVVSEYCDAVHELAESVHFHTATQQTIRISLKGLQRKYFKISETSEITWPLTQTQIQNICEMLCPLEAQNFPEQSVAPDKNLDFMSVVSLLSQNIFVELVEPEWRRKFKRESSMEPHAASLELFRVFEHYAKKETERRRNAQVQDCAEVEFLHQFHTLVSCCNFRSILRMSFRVLLNFFNFLSSFWSTVYISKFEFFDFLEQEDLQIRGEWKATLKNSRTFSQMCGGSRSLAMHLDSQISSVLQTIWKRQRTETLVLLTGAPNSGKRTILRQVETLSSRTLSKEHREDITDEIREMVVASIRWLICELDRTSSRNCDATASAVGRLRAAMEDSDDLSPELGVLIAGAWRDEDVQKIWSVREANSIPDSMAYFFDKIGELSQRNYVVDASDLLHLPAVEPQFVEEVKFKLGNDTIRLIQVANRHSYANNKLLNMFSNVSTILFTASLAAYDQVDSQQTLLRQSIDDFADLINQPWFQNVSNVLVLLTKADVFSQKLSNRPICEVEDWRDYEGESGDVDRAIQYFAEKFSKACAANLSVRSLVATDFGQVHELFQGSCKANLKSRQ